MNYLNLEKYAEARDILKQMHERRFHSFEAFYNLGLAYQGLKNYSSAVVNFRQASKIIPTMPTLIINSATVFTQLGNVRSGARQYLILLDKDPNLAEKLQDVLGPPRVTIERQHLQGSCKSGLLLRSPRVQIFIYFFQ